MLFRVFRKIQEPGGKLLGPAKWTSRQVFVNGEKDFNRIRSRLVYEDLRRQQGFECATLLVMTLLVMKGKGHEYPDAT